MSRQSGEDLWLGLIAACGCTINYFAGIFLKARDKTRATDKPPAGNKASGSAESHRDPETPLEWAVFVFR